jgi:lantibiotic transport system permease protein
MKGFLLSLQSEFYKSRKTLGFWSAILLPLVIIMLESIGFFVKSGMLAKNPPRELWGQFAGIPMAVMGSFLLPMFAVFVGYSVNNIEHRSDTWKMLFTLPINKWSLYSAKFVYAVILVFICLLLFCGFTIGFANLLHLIKPQLRFNEYHMEDKLAQIYFKLFLASMGILSLQFLMSLLWKDFLKPMGIGFVGVIVGSILVRWEYAYLFPYSQPLQAIMTMGQKVRPQDPPVFFTKEVGVSLIIAAVVFIAGFFIVQRKSIK